MRIYAIPYAGASAKVFISLKEKLAGKIYVIPMDLPGHGKMCDKQCVDNIKSMAQSIYEQIQDEIDQEDYSLLGYCMGSWVMCELYYIIKKNKKPLPKTLFIFATNYDQLKQKKHGYSDMSNEQLVKELVDTNQLPEDIASNHRVLQFILPIMRTDLSAVENYRFRCLRPKIKARGIIIYSKDDQEAIHKWNKVFAHSCEYYKINSSHLFLGNESDNVSDIILAL